MMEALAWFISYTSIQRLLEPKFKLQLSMSGL